MSETESNIYTALRELRRARPDIMSVVVELSPLLLAVRFELPGRQDYWIKVPYRQAEALGGQLHAFITQALEVEIVRQASHQPPAIPPEPEP